jgi:hypothetical protein
MGQKRPDFIIRKNTVKMTSHTLVFALSFTGMVSIPYPTIPHHHTIVGDQGHHRNHTSETDLSLQASSDDGSALLIYSQSPVGEKDPK